MYVKFLGKEKEMDYRNEWKHEISYSDLIAIRQRMKVIAELDEHVNQNGNYKIRSLYFDTLTDKALREKIDGVNKREKFRIRCYDGNTSIIHLEKKSKWNGMGKKQIANLTKEETQALIDGDIEWMIKSGRALVIELYSKMKSEGLRPKTIVEYTREPFVLKNGNVRVTLDYDIRTGLRGTDFLNPACVMIPAGDPVIILEVKWDEYLPAIVRSAVQMKGTRSSAFSKYRVCRIYN